jgi:Cytochrome c554 and c-prime
MSISLSRPQRRPGRTRAAVVGLATLAALAGMARPSTASRAPSAVTLTSAEECGRCHVDIARYWKASRHAQAADNPRFQALLARLKQDGVVDLPCVRCHAPAVVYMQDTRWEKKTSWEGVTCDFCHSVRSIGTDPKRPFVLEVGRVKTGPLRNANPTVHGASFSEVYTSSTLCAPCHQYVNGKHFAVLTTFSEWQASPYPGKDITCQSCHMRATSGKVVDPKVARTSGTSVNVHEMPGGHSLQELNRALQAQIAALRRGDTVEVTVRLANRGAGHRLPTGSPLRAIVMVVEATGSIGQTQTATRTYARVVVDESGKELTDEGTVWLRAVRVVRDDRIAPGEQRVEKFTFKLPRSTPAHAAARFYYRYAPDATLMGEPGVPFLTINTWLPSERP